MYFLAMFQIHHENILHECIRDLNNVVAIRTKVHEGRQCDFLEG
jgi:hypothetical protein